MNSVAPTDLTAGLADLRVNARKSLTSKAITLLKGLALLVLVLRPLTTNADINSPTIPAKAASAELTIGIMGDSLSAGYGLKQQEGWADLLSQKLATSHPNIKVVNASVSGATTDAGLQMLAGLLQQQPDIVILELGANDGLQGKPLGLIKRNLSTLIAQTQATGAQVLLAGIQLPPNLGKRYTEPFFDQFKILALQYNTALVPFLLEGVAGNPSLMQADGLHPNRDAQHKILANIWQPLESLITQKTETHKTSNIN